MLTFLFGAPARSGPGTQVIVQIPSGPVPNDDYIVCALTETSSGLLIAQGQTICHGNLNVQVFLGHQERLGGVDFGRPEGVAQGVAVTLDANQWHANGTLVDSSASTAYGVLDTLANSWTLLHWLSGEVDPAIAAILAAVQRTYTNA